MNYYSIPALVGFLINFYLFWFVLVKKTDTDFKINFLLYLFGITGYCFAEFFQLNLQQPEKILFFLRLLVILLYFSVPALLIIILYLNNRKINKRLYYLYLLYLPLPYFIIRPDLIITQVKPIFFGYHGEWGIITKFIGFFSLIYLPICIYFLIKSYLKNRDDIYLKKSYYGFSIFLSSAIILFWFILLMQGVFKNFSYRIGTFSSTLTISGLVIFYLIYHFKFLNIQIILKNILNYAVAIIFVCVSILIYLILYISIKIEHLKPVIFISLFVTFIIYLIFRQKILDIARVKFFQEEESFIKNFINYIEPLLNQKTEQGIIKKLSEILKDIFKAGDMIYIRVKSQELRVKSQELRVKSQELRVKSQELRVKSQKLRVKSQKLRVESQKLRVESQELEKFFEQNDFLELNPFEERKIISEIGLSTFNKLKKNGIRLLFALKVNNKLNGIIGIKDKITGEVFTFYEILLIEFTIRFISLLIQQLKLFKKIERREKQEFKEKIVSIILHDLKNILSSLEMSIKNIARFFHYKEFRKDLIILFENTLKKIEQIEFKLAHIREEKLNKVMINPAKEIREIIKEFNNYKIKLELNEKKKKILFDKEKFTQVIKNLIMNAIESSDLSTSTILIKTEFRNKQYKIIIKDNGKGIKKDFIENKLFKPFTTTKPRGLGLGLYNCKEILHLHNGKIEIKSKIGQGTIVTIIIKV